MGGPVSARHVAARHVVVWCPHWPVIAAGLAADTVGAVVHNQQVVAVTRAGRAVGVRVGMRRRDAQSRYASLELVEYDESRDARRFEPVVRALGEIVPVLEVAEAGTVLFGARGPSRWCGGDHALADRVLDIVRSALTGSVSAGPVDTGATVASPIDIGVGIADGRFAALVMARYAARLGRPLVIESGREATAAALATVPVRSLAEVADVPVDLVDLFTRLGLQHLGDLAALDSADIGGRFGPVGTFAHRLARGDDERHPAGRAPSPDLAVAQTFDDPVLQVSPLVFTARQLADTLYGSIAARGERCTRLLVEAETDHGERSERQWYLADGFAAAAMVERVRWQLEGWVQQPGGLSAGVVLLRLTPTEVRVADGRQLGFWGEASDADEQAQRVVARLVGLLGPDAVLVPEWGGGRHAGDRYRWVPAVSVDLEDVRARHRAVQPGASPWPGTLAAPSPAWWAPQPEQIEVLDDRGAMVQVDGRGALSATPVAVRRGVQVIAVRAWAGPWPTDERWWDPSRRRRRARFQLVLDDHDALLVCLERGAWWLEGRYR